MKENNYSSQIVHQKKKSDKDNFNKTKNKQI